MNSFLVALQFLTRIQLSGSTNWQESEFGKSVTWFTLIGIIIGFILCAIYALLSYIQLPLFTAFILAAADFYLTGGTLYDGLMDASDGLFSGRTKERALEIMKDSSIGSYALCSMLIVFFSKVFSWASIDQNYSMMLILMAMPVFGRLSLVLSICLYPYARPFGMGKSFATYHTSFALPAALIISLLPALYFGFSFIILGGFGILFTLLLNRFVMNKIDGTTGDTYGFAAEFTESFLAILFVILLKVFPCLI